MDLKLKSTLPSLMVSLSVYDTDGEGSRVSQGWGPPYKLKKT